MQNEFEKRVQQKIEELNLVPSDPVWQKVELQIRRKKDRRRFIFWIPLLILLLGGGLWMGIDYSSKNISYKPENHNQENKSHTPLDHFTTTTKTNQRETEKTAETKTIKHSDVTSNVSLKQSSFKRRSVQKLISKKKNSFSIVEQRSSADDISLINSEAAKKTSVQPEQRIPDTISAIELKDTATIVNNEKKTETTVPKTDSLTKDSSSITKPDVKKRKEAKWKYALLVNAGTSGLNRFNLFNADKSLASTPNYNGGSTSGGGPFYYGPSAVQKGFSFEVGAIAKKQIGKRTSLFTGLRYNYYSNTIHVGSRIMQNTIIADFSVSQYYSNRSVAQQPYRNQYHFISLPAAFEWQLLKKKSLNFHIGLSLQYLVQTNALRFDYNSQSYFHSKEAFNSTQLFSEFGLTYSVPIKQKEITFGAQLEYGLSKLEKGNSTNHLFSYGMKVQWQLSKK